MYGYIYKTTNLVTGQMYIGMRKFYKDEDSYIGSGKVLKQAIKKYGKLSFKKETLEECSTFEEMCEAEIKWISHFDAVNNPSFYNIAYGGHGGCSESTKEYWSQFTPEERKKMRRWGRSPVNGDNNPMYGKKHSDETKKLIGSKSVNRNWHKPDHHGSKNPKSKKAIITINGVETEYSCLKEFWENNQHIPYSTLKGVARGSGYCKKYDIGVRYA